MNMGKWKLAGAGALCLAFGLFCVSELLSKSAWRKAEATITNVTIECAMKASERHVGYKTISTATIPCDEVDAFKAYHADKSWTTTENIHGTLRVLANGETVQAKMDLRRTNGELPQVGDVFPVLQNPNNPSSITRPDMPGATAMFGVVAFLLGGALLFFAFRASMPKAKRAPQLNEEDDAAASALRAEAALAAAMAKRGPAMAAPRQTVDAAVRAHVAAAPAPAAQDQARSSFGRKKAG